VAQRHLQLGLFDERHLLEISSPDFPGERLLACRNPELAKLRAHTRDDLLLATGDTSTQARGTMVATPDSISKSSVHFVGFASRTLVLSSLRLRVHE
jgi:hypothetical protein